MDNIHISVLSQLGNDPEVRQLADEALIALTAKLCPNREPLLQNLVAYL